MIITIDGPSGTGKTTVAKEVAKRLNFAYFDTGAMYRAVAWKLLNEEIAVDDLGPEALLRLGESNQDFARRGRHAGERSTLSQRVSARCRCGPWSTRRRARARRGRRT